MQAVIPRLPREVLWGSLGEYPQIMLPTTEAPWEFHFGAMATLLSGLFSGPYVQMGTQRLHANQFGILAGTTGVTHKTTAVRAALQTVERAAGGSLTVIHGTGSREGILKALETVKPPGSPVVLRVGEFTSFLKKAENKATSSLTETLLQLYDREDRIENRLAAGSVVVERPNVVLLGDTTETNLVDTFRAASIGNGLLNRLSIYLGEPGGPIPFPPPPPEAQLAAWVERVSDAWAAAQSLGEIRVDSVALDQWDPIYKQQVHPRQTGVDGPVLARLGARTWQIALLHCLLDQRATISPDDLQTGWQVATYLGECAIRVAGSIGSSEKARLLDRLEQTVRDNPMIKAGYVGRHLSTSQRSLADSHGGVKKLLDQLVADERIDYDAAGECYFVDPGS